MSESVYYMNLGTRCYPRLLTSIFSLRKHYNGNIVVLQEGELNPEIANILSRLSVEIRPIDESMDRILVKKSSIWREMREDHVMYLDSDTIVRGPIDVFFDWIKEKGFVATWFTGWSTTGIPTRTRIEEWKKAAPDLICPALKYGKAINSGVQGWSKNAPILAEYEKLTRQGFAAGCNRLVLDEIALQLLLPHYSHHLAHHVWNTSAIYGNIQKAKIVHYHGRKHCIPQNDRCDLWKQHYFEMLASFPDYAIELRKHWGDLRLKIFSNIINRRRPSVTVVTAVELGDVDKFKRNFSKWIQLYGLKKQNFVVFINPSKYAHLLRFYKKHPNIKIIRWNHPKRLNSYRKFTCSATTFGVAKHVKTRYWMNLIANDAPLRNWWEWPDYAKNPVTYHAQILNHLNSIKDASQNELNMSDNPVSHKQQFCECVLERNDDSNNFQHKSLNELCGLDKSYFIERTSFTRKLASCLDPFVRSPVKG